jgi:hypothetical protein
MTTSKPTTQSAADRRSAEAELTKLIAKFAPTDQALVGTMRRSFRKHLPGAYEVVYEYSDSVVISLSPDERGYEGVLAIRVSEKGVDLYFNRGKALSDPEKLLQGSAKLVRFIHMEGASTLKRPAVARLIDEAIAQASVPFATTGRGPVIIRSTTAKKRQAKSA